MKTLMVMAGGTGGHIFPGIAVAEELRARGWRIVWMGNPDGMEARIVPQRGYETAWVRFGALRGKGLLRKLLLPVNLLSGFWQALREIRRARPDVVLGMGGYITFPGGMMAALAVFSALGLHLGKRHWLAAGVAVAVTGIIFGQRFFRGVSAIGFDFATVDRFTNGRATIWWQALSSPPENPWLGVGMGNLVSRVEILRIDDLAGIGEVTVRHLHNFILDAWYETGILGLSAFLAMLGVVLARVLRTWPGPDQEHRRIAAAALAGVVALLTAGLLSFSYTSKQFALYLYLLLAILLALPGKAEAAGGLRRNRQEG